MKLERLENISQQQMIKSIFRQDLAIKEFKIKYDSILGVCYVSPKVILNGESNIFHECLLPLKLLEGETFHIKSLNKDVVIDRYFINDDGSITYYIREIKVLNEDDEVPAWMESIRKELNDEFIKCKYINECLENIKDITNDNCKLFKSKAIKYEIEILEHWLKTK